MCRVPLHTKEDLPAAYQDQMDRVTKQRNVFQAVANNPPVLKAFLDYAMAIGAECGLSDYERELAILCIARTLESKYVWQQHVELSRSVGVTPTEQRALGTGELGNFSPRNRAILEFVRGFVTDDISAADIEALADRSDYSTVVGVGLLAGNYMGTIRMLDVFAIPLEGDFVGWQPD